MLARHCTYNRSEYSKIKVHTQRWGGIVLKYRNICICTMMGLPRLVCLTYSTITLNAIFELQGLHNGGSTLPAVNGFVNHSSHSSNYNHTIIIVICGYKTSFKYYQKTAALAGSVLALGIPVPKKKFPVIRFSFSAHFEREFSILGIFIFFSPPIGKLDSTYWSYSSTLWCLSIRVSTRSVIQKFMTFSWPFSWPLPWLFIRFYFIHFSRLNSISIILFWENTGSASENYEVFEILNHSCYSSM